MVDRYDEARAWVRGFSQTGADVHLEDELRRGRLQKRGFGSDGVPTHDRPQRSVRSDGEPLSQPVKPGAVTVGGPLSVTAGGATMRRDPTGCDAT